MIAARTLFYVLLCCAVIVQVLIFCEQKYIAGPKHLSHKMRMIDEELKNVTEHPNENSTFSAHETYHKSLSNIHLHSRNGITISNKEIKAGDPAHVRYVKHAKEREITKLLQQVQESCPRNDHCGESCCPCVPPKLKGKMAIDLNSVETYSWEDVSIIAQAGTLGEGGTWRPENCTARWKILIVIPYRERETQLKAFLAHTHPILQRQQLDYRILVVEQRNPALFNKAAMMNIAYKELVARKWMVDCIVFQDVDMIMEDDRNLLRCGRRFYHYGAYVDRFDYKVKNGILFGGVVSMTPDQFKAVNGFSNLFFGHGGEDDNMFYRMKHANFSMFRPSPLLNRYSTLKHVRDKKNPHWTKRLQLARHHHSEEGLSSVKYNMVSEATYKLYTHLIVDLNGLNYPESIRQTSLLYGVNMSSDCPALPNLNNQSYTKGKFQKEEKFLESCMDNCAMNKDCTSFVYHHDNMTCVLKGNDCDQRTSANPLTSLYMKGRDLKLGNLTRHYEAHISPCDKNDLSKKDVASLHQCAQECLENTKCVAFTHDGRKCSIKSICVPPIAVTSKTHSFIKIVK